MTTTVFFCHCSILTVKYRLCLTKYRRNRINFLRVVSYANNKGSVGFILSKVSVMRISIPLDFKDATRDRTCGAESLVPVLAARLPHVHRTRGCVVNLPHNRPCGVTSLLDLSSRSFIPLPCFIRSRRPLPLLDPSLVFSPRCSVKRHIRGVYLRVLSDFLTPHSFSVTFLTLSLRPCLFYCK